MMDLVISAARYNELRKAEEELIALEEAGVDNWEGYGEAERPEEGKDYSSELRSAPMTCASLRRRLGQPELGS